MSALGFASRGGAILGRGFFGAWSLVQEASLLAAQSWEALQFGSVFSISEIVAVMVVVVFVVLLLNGCGSRCWRCC